jgi:subtilase family serine protease
MLSNPFQSFLRRLNNSRGKRQRIKRTSRRNGRRTISQQERECGSAVETLEERVLLTAAPIATAGLVAHPTFIIEGHESTPGRTSVKQATSGAAQPAPVAPIDPAQMEAAYGVNLISFGGVKGTGAGQTIAIVDAYNDPNIVADANSFSSTFGLPQFNGSGLPTFQVLNQTGGTNLSAVPNSTPGGWDVEESLDVEWAHSIAPQANIILFEANSDSYSDLLTAEQTAAATPAVSAVSNSWGSSEFNGEQDFDSYFTTPAGHQGVTFLASAGDDGAPALYPAYSPNVVAVGGTTLDMNSSGTYEAESAWSGTGGGVSQFEAQPSYQTGKVNGTSSTNRTAPDVSLDADPNTGVYVLDSYFGGYLQVGGTDLSSPMMAGLVAIADQGRILNGLTTLDGPSQTLPLLYDLSSGNFHDITTGNNGFAAGPGYDLASGLGSPIANDLVTALAGYQSSQPATVTAPLSASLIENGTYTFSGTISATDAAASGKFRFTVAFSHRRHSQSEIDRRDHVYFRRQRRVINDGYGNVGRI